MGNVGQARRRELTEYGKLEWRVVKGRITLAREDDKLSGPLSRPHLPGQTGATLNNSESLEENIESGYLSRLIVFF
jgi:hypothetical protein